jgi:thioesterase domain-containing protein
MSATPISIDPTPLQDAMWWIHQRVQDKSVYHITWRLTCAAPLDFSALSSAWQAVVDRHEALRMSFDHKDGVLTTTIAPAATATARLIEVPEPGSTPADTLIRTIAEEVHGHEFSLDQAPLARLVVVTVADLHELLFTAHHSVLDGWAIQLLFADLSHAYACVLRGDPPTFDTAPVPWHDYAREQRDARASGRWQTSIDHWCSTLDGAVATTVAPDRDRTSLAGSPGTTVRYTFSRSAVDGLATLAKNAGATPFAAMLGALQVVLARGGAGPDVSVGVVAANRLSQRDQQLAGYLANVCLARAEITNHDSITDVVVRARDFLWQLLAHQSVPYPVVFAALPESTKSTLANNIPVMLNYLGSISEGLRLGDVGLTMRRSPNRSARTDLAIAYWDSADEVVAEVEYNTVRYERDTVLRLLQDLDGVLATGHDRQLVGNVGVRTRSTTNNAAHTTAEASTNQEFVESAITRQVAQTWADVLGYPPEHPDEDFFESGGHSLNAVQFVAMLADDTGTELDLAAWLSDPTPRRITDLLSGTGSAAATSAPSTVVTMQQGTGRHLHLLLGAGGAPSDYRALIAALPDDWRITLSQERQPQHSIPDMAAGFLADLTEANLRPDLIAGWSMGGQVAFELAAGYGESAPGVVLIDAPPPIGLVNSEELVRQRLDEFVRTVCLTVGTTPPGSLPTVSDGAIPMRLVAVAGWLRASGYDLSAHTLIERWDTYHRHAGAVGDYVSHRVLNTPTILIAADLADDGIARWRPRFHPAPAVRRVDADHFSVLRAPAVDVVAHAIARLPVGAAVSASSTLG